MKTTFKPVISLLLAGVTASVTAGQPQLNTEGYEVSHEGQTQEEGFCQIIPNAQANADGQTGDSSFCQIVPEKQAVQMKRPSVRIGGIPWFSRAKQA